MNTQTLFIGVDGGATKCLVRVEDDKGQLLGKKIGGPANIQLSVTETWQSILSTLNELLGSLSLSTDLKKYQFYAGMGLAGCEIPDAYQAFLNYPHPFKSLIVSSDAHTACLGAHNGEDGAIIIAGTGVVGFQMLAGKISKVGGWGFPHDDEGGGAWMGLQAARATLQWLDGRIPESKLVKEIYRFFDEDQMRFIKWVNKANSTAFAELAPLVIQQSQSKDELAISILKQAAAHIDKISDALLKAQSDQQPLPCTLVGGVANYIAPYLNSSLQVRLRPANASPDAGAVLLARQHLRKK